MSSFGIEPESGLFHPSHPEERLKEWGTLMRRRLWM
jgi:hypothetical protein